MTGAAVFVLLAAAVAIGVYLFVHNHQSSPAAPPRVRLNWDMGAASWNIAYSPGMPAHPVQNGAGWSFDFPRFPSSVHYVTVSTGSLAGSRGMSAGFRVVTTGSPAFDSLDQGAIDPGQPGRARLYFQRRGDDMSGAGPMEFYRWWSVEPTLLAAGAVNRNVPFEPAQWLSVMGKHGDASPDAAAAFSAAIADIGAMGITFGGQFAGHGVAISGDGTAQFIMDSFEVG